ncbi:MAG TPA: 3-hydroxyisobutyrate dehydrogenase [Azospirillum sp.]
MATVAFIGLGNMGLPMAANLLKAGHRVIGYDVAAACLEKARAAGAEAAAGAAQAAAEADVVITMLPTGREVRAAYTGPGGLIGAARPGALLVDCSTIDIETARAVAAQARDAGYDMLDAPVSGGTIGASAATLTFMVGGQPAAFGRAEPILAAMGRAVIHAGPSGTGQAAKICNNMIAGITMIGVSEAFVLAGALGLDAQKLFDIASRSSGQCWALTTYCPVPGPAPGSPANRGYEGGFAAGLMLKDLRLAQMAAMQSGAATPMGAEAAALYALFCNSGRSGMDFSAIIKMIAGE